MATEGVLDKRKLYSWPQVAALLCWGVVPLCIASCAQRVAVLGIPVIEQVDERNEEAVEQAVEPSPSAEIDGERGRYWSAFAYLGDLAFLKHWGELSGDYAFITAKIKLPVRGHAITREFPLYTIKGASILSHQGVDLLQKFPLSSAAREQVLITLEVRYLANAKALDIARSVLSNAEELAKPYLKNFPLASDIMTSAVSLVDKISEKEEEGINSATFAIDVQSRRQHSGTEAIPEYVLRGYLFVKQSEEIEIAKDLRQCADMKGALCKGGQNYASHGYHDKPYITLRFEPRDDVYDPVTVLPGSSACTPLNGRDLSNARQYLRDNAALFLEKDIAIAETAYLYAEKYLLAQELATKKDYGSMLDILNETGTGAAATARLGVSDQSRTQPEVMLQSVTRCFDELWTRHPWREVRNAWAVAQGSQETPSVERLAALGQLLRRMVSLYGKSGNWQDETFDSGGMFLRALVNEGRTLVAQQERDVQRILDDSGKCDKPTVTEAKAMFTKGECPNCVKTLNDFCRSQKVSDEISTLLAAADST